MSRIGVFGGTFDPVHIGHLIMAQETVARLKLDRLLFVAANRPSHKRAPGLADVEHRIAMLRLAVRGNRRFEVSRIEATIANCLEYARPLTPGMVQTEPVGLLDEAIALASQRKGSEEVRVVRAYAAAGLVPVHCDRTLIKESLVNILVNAYEAMEGPGTITVSAECVPARAYVEPSERGNGPAAPHATGAPESSTSHARGGRASRKCSPRTRRPWIAPPMACRRPNAAR